MSVRDGWNAVVTFESSQGEPTCVRTTIVDSEPEVAARKAVFRALSEGKPRRFESVTIVLTERRAVPAVDRVREGEATA